MNPFDIIEALADTDDGYLVEARRGRPFRAALPWLAGTAACLLLALAVPLVLAFGIRSGSASPPGDAAPPPGDADTPTGTPTGAVGESRMFTVYAVRDGELAELQVEEDAKADARDIFELWQRENGADAAGLAWIGYDQYNGVKVVVSASGEIKDELTLRSLQLTMAEFFGVSEYICSVIVR